MPPDRTLEIAFEVGHPIADLDDEGAFARPGICQLQAVSGLTEVDLLLVGRGLHCSRRFGRTQCIRVRKGSDIFGGKSIHPHRAGDVLYHLFA